MQQDWINALAGGILIGLAVSLMLLWNGRVTGISGIINGIFSFQKGDTAWRMAFTLGLISGGFIIKQVKADAFSGTLNTGVVSTIIAGLLVGFGTILGSGCTSGHGVCGISRLSPRSILATITFILAGILFVYLFKKWGILS